MQFDTATRAQHLTEGLHLALLRLFSCSPAVRMDAAQRLEALAATGPEALRTLYSTVLVALATDMGHDIETAAAAAATKSAPPKKEEMN